MGASCALLKRSETERDYHSRRMAWEGTMRLMRGEAQRRKTGQQMMQKQSHGVQLHRRNFFWVGGMYDTGYGHFPASCPRLGVVISPVCIGRTLH